MTVKTTPVLQTTPLSSPEFKSNPFPFYAQLRETAPVYHTSSPYFPSLYLVTRYEDVVAVLKDDKRFVKNRYNTLNAEQLKKQPWTPGIFKPLEKNMLDLDDPDHARLRNLVHKAFTPRMIEQMRERVQIRANELLDRVQAKGKMDLIADFALPLPLTIIGDILGIPPTDTQKFHRWTKSLMDLTGNPSPLRALPVIPNLWFLMRYIKKAFRDRKLHPQNDLMTALVQAEEQGDTLNDDELMAMVFILLIAGHETTVNLIGSGMLALLEHPDQREKLQQDPTLIRTAVEELLRYCAPVEQATERFAMEEVEMHGVRIPKGELVFAVLASANRDPAVFTHPDALDITREPNRHLAFGQGGHYCVGAPLARLEGAIAINTLLERMPHLQLAVSPQQLRWRSTMVVRGLEALPVVF